MGLIKELPPPPQAGKTGWPWSLKSSEIKYGSKIEDHWPTISIVTPSYNQGRFLEETIRSVLLQNYPNLEFIIIDGGSTDDSVEIIKKYEPWITHWESKPDHGQSDALMKGFRKASGDIFCWLNSDDLLAPKATTIAALYFLKFNNMGMIYGDRNVLNEASEIIASWYYLPFFRWQLRFRSGIAQETAFWRASLFKDVCGLDISLNYAMDYDLWWKFSKKFHLHHLPIVLGGWRNHETAKSVLVEKDGPKTSFVEKMSDEFDLVQKKHLGHSTSTTERKILKLTHRILLKIYIGLKIKLFKEKRTKKFLSKNNIEVTDW